MATVLDRQRAIVNRRRTNARNFRKRLTAALIAKTGAAPTFEESELIELAVSCRTEAVEISSLYLIGKAPSTKMARLGGLRTQLVRLLGALGLVGSLVETPDEPPDAALTQYLEDWHERQAAATKDAG